MVGCILSVWSIPNVCWIELNGTRIYDVRCDSAHKQRNEHGHLHNRNVDQHGADATAPTHEQCKNFSRQSRWNMLRRKVRDNKLNEVWPTHVRCKGQDQPKSVVFSTLLCMFGWNTYTWCEICQHILSTHWPQHSRWQTRTPMQNLAWVYPAPIL